MAPGSWKVLSLTTGFLKATSIQPTRPTKPGASPKQECCGMLQRGMTHPHVMGASCHRGPQPLGMFSLGPLEWEKYPAAVFLAAESSERGCNVPWRGLRAAHSPALPSPAAPTPRGLGWKLSTAKCRLLVSYLEFCLNWWQFGLCQDDEQSGSRQGMAV